MATDQSRRYPYAPFDYRKATSGEIHERARELIGKTLGQVAQRPALPAVSTAHTKGYVGGAIERFFGIPPNSLAAADFPGAGVELKTVPVVRRGSERFVKERTAVSLIDYVALAEETWAQATVRKKLSSILFVFYEWSPDVDMSGFPVIAVSLWSPDAETWVFLEADWEAVQAKVMHAQAHLITEADGRILGAATKSATGLSRRRQPFSNELAKPRAWALKPGFTRSILLEAVRPAQPVESLIDNLGVARPLEFEREVLEHFERFVGRRLGMVADDLGVPHSKAKDWSARVVRRALGTRDPASRIQEFAQQGIEIKVVSVRDDARPHEHTSFPAMRYHEVIQEEWEDSDLLARINRILFVPLLRPKRGVRQAEGHIQRPFFWSPSPKEHDGIRREWQAYREEIASGKADRLTPASRTSYIHVRPHGSDKTDVDDAPGVGPVVKKCFWLNGHFVQTLIRGAGWQPTIRR
jgi:DNA mismatch repair protein MutH